MLAPNQSTTNLFRYPGRENDSVSGLYYYRATYYDSSIGGYSRALRIAGLFPVLGDLSLWGCLSLLEGAFVPFINLHDQMPSVTCRTCMSKRGFYGGTGGVESDKTPFLRNFNVA